MDKSNFKNLPVTEFLWNDRKRWLGLPVTFTKYKLSDDRIFLEKGLLNTKSDEVLLYRVRDLSMNITLGQRILGVGTINVISSDKTIPLLTLKNVKYPRQVKELIHQTVEKAKERRNMKPMEIMSDSGDDLTNGLEHDGDFDPDDFEDLNV